MPSPTKKACLSCSHSLPIATQYDLWQGVASVICIHCAILDPRQVALNVQNHLATVARVKRATRDGRRQARIERRQESYALTGKRCSACWHYKPITDYSASHTTADGLQYVCRFCAQINHTFLQRVGGQQAWHTYRDAIRAKAPPKATNHGTL